MPTKTLLVCASLIWACPSAQADGFRILFHGAAAAGQANAFAAQADDASALFYNPAGLSQLSGVHVSAGMNFVGGGTTFTSLTGRAYTNDYGGDFAFPAPSNFYLTAKLSDLGFKALGPLTLAIGLNSPYGLSSRWNGTTPFSSVVTRARLPMLDIKPTLAYAINDMFSIGLGLDIYTFAGFIGAGEFESRSVIPGVGTSELNGNGTGVGYNASVLFTPLRGEDGKPQINIGFVYRSGAQIGLAGDFLINGKSMAKTQSALTIPDIFTGAVAGWPIRDRFHEWKIEYDMEFVDWSAVQNFEFAFSNGQFLSVPQRWHSIYTANLGTEFKWLEASFLPDWNIALRTGYLHANSPIPDQTFNPQLVDSNFNGFTVGLGVNCRDKGRFLGLIECGNESGKSLTARSVGMDLAFQTLFYDSRQIVGNIQPSVDGHYNSTVYIGSLNFNLSY